MKAKLSFLYDHHFKFPNRNTVFIFKVNVFQCKHVFPNGNFEENVIIMCLASHFDIIESGKLIVGHCEIYYAKINIKSFGMCGV